MCVLNATGLSAIAGLESARSALESHQYDSALAAVDQFLEQNPKNPEAMILKSDVFAARGEWDHAVDVLEAALSEHQDNVDLLLALAVTYREKLMRSGMLGKMSNAKKSRQALEKAFTTEPTHLQTRRQMVMYLVNAPGFAGGDKERAEGIALETVEIDQAEGSFQMAAVYWKKGELDTAVIEYRKALQLDPDNFEALTMLGQVFIGKEEFDNCSELFKAAIITHPDDPEPYIGLGECYSEQKRTDEAIEQFLIALDKDGWAGVARFKVAKLYEKVKEPEKAAYHYKILLERNPGYVDIGKAKKRLRKIEKGR